MKKVTKTNTKSKDTKKKVVRKVTKTNTKSKDTKKKVVKSTSVKPVQKVKKTTSDTKKFIQYWSINQNIFKVLIPESTTKATKLISGIKKMFVNNVKISKHADKYYDSFPKISSLCYTIEIVNNTNTKLSIKSILTKSIPKQEYKIIKNEK